MYLIGTFAYIPEAHMDENGIAFFLQLLFILVFAFSLEPCCFSFKYPLAGFPARTVQIELLIMFALRLIFSSLKYKM